MWTFTNMLAFLIVTTSIVNVTTLPFDNTTKQNGENQQTEAITEENVPTTSNLQVIKFEKDLAIVSYIEHFKTIMTDYVKSQYNNLTFAEIDKVKEILEEFLTTFAKDLREVVGKQSEGENDAREEENVEFGIIKDGLPNSTFEEINRKIGEEFPQLTEKTVNEIVHRLRTNLYVTRQKIDRVIRQSKLAYLENSE